MSQYTITSEKVETIALFLMAAGYTATLSEIKEFCTADWAEGDEHQAWLDSAPPREIADWIIAGEGAKKRHG